MTGADLGRSDARERPSPRSTGGLTILRVVPTEPLASTIETARGVRYVPNGEFLSPAEGGIGFDGGIDSNCD